MQYLPIAPILAALAAVGGIELAPGLRGNTSIAFNEDGELETTLTSEGRTIYWRYHKMIARAAGKGGTLTEKAADKLCCHLLRVHPAEVYGWDVWLALVEPDQAVVAAAA